MRVLENRFYETVKLPKSPYVDASRREGDPLPSYPPQGFGNSLEGDTRRGNRNAEDFIDKLLDLDRKRRGITEGKSGRRAASLNLSGPNLGQYASPNYEKLNHVTPFYDTFTDKQGLVQNSLASPKFSDMMPRQDP